MNILKILGCILILAAPTIGGYIYSEGFKKRVVQLNELERCLTQLENEILFTHTPLTEVFFNISRKSKYPINEIFEMASDLLMSNKVEDVFEAVNKALASKKEVLNLKKEDLDIILDLSKTLGESDVDGQKSVFRLTRENLKKQIQLAENVMKKNVKLYRYLGFSVGAALVIMVI